MKINLWLTFGMANRKCINYEAIIAQRAQSLLPLLIQFDRFLHIDKSRQTEQCSSHLQGVIHLPPQVTEQTSCLNAHLNRTPIIFQDKWPIQTSVASTAPGSLQEHETRARTSQNSSKSCSCVGIDKQKGFDLPDWCICN